MKCNIKYYISKDSPSDDEHVSEIFFENLKFVESYEFLKFLKFFNISNHKLIYTQLTEETITYLESM